MTAFYLSRKMGKWKTSLFQQAQIPQLLPSRPISQLVNFLSQCYQGSAFHNGIFIFRRCDKCKRAFATEQGLESHTNRKRNQGTPCGIYAMLKKRFSEKVLNKSYQKSSPKNPTTTLSNNIRSLVALL